MCYSVLLGGYAPFYLFLQNEILQLYLTIVHSFYLFTLFQGWDNNRFNSGNPSFLLSWGENQTETEVIVAVVGGVVVAVSHPAVLRIVVPATTSIHAIRPFGYSPVMFKMIFFRKPCESACFVKASNGVICN